MPGPFGSGAFGTSVFAPSPLFTTKDLIDSVLRHTGHSNPSQETTKRQVVLDMLNNRYARITTARHWDWLFNDVDFNIQPPYSTGTITATQGSKVVTGLDTVWTAEHANGQWLMIIRDEVYRIESVDSTTQITLESEYAQADAAGVGYFITNSILELPADCEHPRSLMIDRAGEAVPMGVQELKRKSQYAPAYVGTPRYYTDIGRRAEDGVRYVLLYPNPDKFYQCHLDYGVNIMKLEDSETNFPLIPDRHRQILYYGALAEMYRYLRDQANAQSAEADFQRGLLVMQGDTQLTDSRLILATEKNYKLRKRRRGRNRLSMDIGDFSRYE